MGLRRLGPGTWLRYYRARRTGGRPDADGSGASRRHKGYRRIPRGEALSIALPAAGKPREIPVPDSDGLVLVVTVRPIAPGTGGAGRLPAGTRSVSVFLVNRRQADPEHAYRSFVFQAVLRLVSGTPFAARPDLRGSFGGDSIDEWDEQVADLQYRDVLEYAVGHSVSADAETKTDGQCCEVRTVWIPRAEVERVVAVERIVLVHRLREVVAQVGFTRFEAAGPDVQGELSLDVKRAPLGIDSPWLPAMENRGEGVFLQFSAAAMDEWLSRDAVLDRGRLLAGGFDIWKTEHQDSSRVFPGIPYYVLHSLSHLLLTAISLECVYPASSLRERVYCADGKYGILIYTGSSDAEGTLGGLVLAGREIKRHMRRALEMGALCSNDPVCAYHRPGVHDHQPLLGAACHGCLLIAETSCEQRNELLDRSLVVSTVEALGVELFPGI